MQQGKQKRGNCFAHATSYRIAQSISMIALCALVLAAQPARSDDVITFNDLTDTISVTVPAARMGPSSCPNTANTSFEECDLSLNPPVAGATVISTTLATFTYIAEDSTGVQASDYLLAEPINPGVSPNYLLSFNSDSDTGPFVACNVSNAGCTIVEDGTVQTLGTITWQLPTGATSVDTVKFQSDAPEVPEPGSFLLLGSGLTSLAGMIRRKLRP